MFYPRTVTKIGGENKARGKKSCRYRTKAFRITTTTDRSIALQVNYNFRVILMFGVWFYQVERWATNFFTFLSANMFLIVLSQLTFPSLCSASAGPAAPLVVVFGIMLGLDQIFTELAITSPPSFTIIMSNYMDNLKDYCRQLRSRKRFVSFSFLSVSTNRSVYSSAPVNELT